MKTLSNAEWAVMTALWERSPLTMSGIITAMGDKMKWKYNTYATYVKRLCDKGFIGYDVMGRDNFYYPRVPQEQCILTEGRSMLEKLNAGAVKPLLVCMIKEGGLTQAEREELSALLEELSRQERY